MSKFKVGDIVTCVKPSKELINGKNYVIKSCHKTTSHTEYTVKLQGDDNFFNAHRFILAKDQSTIQTLIEKTLCSHKSNDILNLHGFKYCKQCQKEVA